MRLLFLLAILVSCATLKKEEDYHAFILKTYEEKKINLASYHILAFEGKYPESTKICELWGLQDSIYKQKNKEDNYIKNVRKKIQEFCK